MSTPAKDPYEAIAHPIRRRILEMLRDRDGIPAGEIALSFPEVSRVAVSKHLAFLRRAGLVQSRRRGRESLQVLDTRQLQAIQEEWLQTFEPLWQRSLENLKEAAEGPG